MATKRRRFTAKFKTRVVMEAFRGDRTIQAIAAKHEVHPNQVGLRGYCRCGRLGGAGASSNAVLSSGRRACYSAA